MALFLGIQGTYHQVHVGLFEDNTLLDTITINNAETSKKLISTIDTLLHTHQVPLNRLSFIAANQGPGPFTTLRTILTTVNGIAFAAGIPLIGIDSLKAVADEWHDATFPLTVVLLDAFNKDVYYYLDSIDHIHNQPHKQINNLLNSTTESQPNNQVLNKTNSQLCSHAGYQNIDVFLDNLMQQQNLSAPIRFIGGAALLYKQKIEDLFGSQAHFPTPMPELCSLHYIGIASLNAWHAQQASQQLLPLYLKKHHAEIKKVE